LDNPEGKDCYYDAGKAGRKILKRTLAGRGNVDIHWLSASIYHSTSRIGVLFIRGMK